MTKSPSLQAPPPPAGGPQVPPTGRRGLRKPLGAIVVAVLMALYAWAQPVLNSQWGWNLPGLPPQAASDGITIGTTASGTNAGGTQAGGTTVDVASDTDSGEGELKYGLLAHQGNERYLSPAGLLYVRGSAEGHRLKHLERHMADIPDRPGRHGVFDGGMATALATIDRAFRQAQSAVRTTKQEEQGRVVYTVDLRSTVGFVGGQEGQRRRHPAARRVRLVLEDNRVITAFPLE